MWMAMGRRKSCWRATSTRTTGSKLSVCVMGRRRRLFLVSATICDGFRLEGIDEFDGEEAGFLGQGLGAGPVAGFAGVVGLGEEAADFFLQILLGGVEDFAVGLL